MSNIPERKGHVAPIVAHAMRANPSKLRGPLGALQGFTDIMLEIGVMENDARAKDYYDATTAHLQNRWSQRYIEATQQAGAYPDKFADGIETEFTADLQTALKDAPNEDVRQALSQDMEELTRGYTRKAKVFETTAIAGFHEGRLGETLDNHLKTAFRAPEEADLLYRQGLLAIDDKANVLPPAALQAQRDAWKGRVYGSAYDGYLEANPHAALKDIESGTWDDVLTSAQIQNATKLARNRVNLLDAEAERADKEKLAELRTTVSLNLADEKAVRAAGQPAGAGGVTDEMVKTAYADQPERATQILGELEVLESVAGARVGLMAAQTVEDENTIIEHFDPGDGPAYTYAENAQAQETLRAMQRQKRKMLQDDPLVFAMQTKLVPDLGPFEPTEAESVQARLKAAHKVRDYYRLPRTVLLTDAEASWLAETFKSADSAQRVRMLDTFASNLDRETYQGVAGQLFAKDQPLMGAVAGVASGGDKETARRILEGADIRRQEKTILPSPADTLPHINDYVGDAFRFLPALKPAYQDAALALYAYAANDAGDRSAIIDGERLSQALDSVTGGLVTWNGVKTLAPRRGMDDDAFARVMDSLTDEGLARYGNGQPVTLSGHPVTAQHIRDYGTLAVVGPSRYAVLLRGAPLMAAGRDGGLDGGRYAIDLSRVPVAPEPSQAVKRRNARHGKRGGGQ